MNKKTEDPEQHEQPDLSRLFADERKKIKPDAARIERIMLKVEHESNMIDLGILIFVRFWLTLLQMGAILYVASVERARINSRRKTILKNNKDQGNGNSQ